MAKNNNIYKTLHDIANCVDYILNDAPTHGANTDAYKDFATITFKGTLMGVARNLIDILDGSYQTMVEWVERHGNEPILPNLHKTLQYLWVVKSTAEASYSCLWFDVVYPIRESMENIDYDDYNETYQRLLSESVVLSQLESEDYYILLRELTASIDGWIDVFVGAYGESVIFPQYPFLNENGEVGYLVDAPDDADEGKDIVARLLQPNSKFVRFCTQEHLDDSKRFRLLYDIVGKKNDKKKTVELPKGWNDALLHRAMVDANVITKTYQAMSASLNVHNKNRELIKQKYDNFN